MKLATTMASEMSSPGHRLDASYHASDGVKVLRFLKEWVQLPRNESVLGRGIIREKSFSYNNHQVDLLGDVCRPGGIYIPGRFKRYYVSDPDHGEKWMSPTDMLKPDLNGLSLVSKKHTPSIENLRIHKDWILLSRSGTIGNCAYVRQDMDGIIGSDDIIRIIVDETKILPGYLFAFISSVIGRALIEQKTYGAVVQHIETHHILDLLIPRLNNQIEEQIHELVKKSAYLRTKANQLLVELIEMFNREILEIPNSYKIQLHHDRSFYWGKSSLKNTLRLDAFHHVGYTTELKDFLKPGPFLKDIAKIFLPGPFKRMYVGASGIPYLSGVDIYQYKPTPRLWLSPRQPELPELILQQKRVVLVQADGQRYGLIGRPAYTDESLVGAALSNHLVRILPKSEELGGYIFLFLSTEAGRRELLRHSYGTSIPTLPVSVFQNLIIPKADSIKASEIGEAAIKALQKRTSANQLEDRAHAILLESLGWNDS